MNEEKKNLLDTFEKIEFLTEKDIKELNFEELALYLQWLNNLEEIHNLVEGDING